MASIHRQELKTRRGGRPVIVYRVRWRDETGTMRSKTLPTEGEARTFVSQVELGLAEQPTPEPAPVVTLDMCVKSWQASRRVSRARTAAEASLVKRFGTLGPRPVEEVTPSDVRALVAALVDEGLAAETVSAILRTLRSVLDTAVEDGRIPSNPAARVKPPKIRRPPLDSSDVYSPAELRALIAHTDEAHRALMAILCLLGTRWSEAAALTRADLDLEAGRIHVGHRVAEEVSGRIVLRDGGKTRGSDRWLPLPAIVRTELEAHLERHPKLPAALLFPTTAGTPISRANATKRIYRPAVEAAAAAEELEDRGITLRNLRHSAASAMLAAGVPVLEVAQRLGHSRPSATLDVYARFVPEREDRSTALLDALLG